MNGKPQNKYLLLPPSKQDTQLVAQSFGGMWRTFLTVECC